MFVTGPEVIKTVTHEEVTKEKLGGAMTHNSVSGVAHFASPTPTPSAWPEDPTPPRPSSRPTTPSSRRGASARPLDRETRARHASSPPTRTSPTTSRTLIRWVADDGDFFEVHQHYAKNLVVGFAPRRAPGRGDRQPAGPPRRRARHQRHVKGARFVRFCDAFNVPCGSSRTSPASCPAPPRSGAGSSATAPSCSSPSPRRPCPKVTVITRKAYGGAYCVMGSKHIRTDFNFAFPTAEIAVMGPQGAVNILYRPRDREGRRPEARRAAAGRRVPGEVRQPLRRRREGLHRRGHPAARAAAQAGGASPCSAASATGCRPRSTGTSRCEEFSILNFEFSIIGAYGHPECGINN
jgi:propionyl-CoA carboxylase beta chain